MVVLVRLLKEQFSNVFRGYRKRPVAWNGLMKMTMRSENSAFYSHTCKTSAISKFNLNVVFIIFVLYSWFFLYKLLPL